MGKIKGELEEPQTQWGQPQDVHSITFNYSSAGVGKLGPLGQIQTAYGLFSQSFTGIQPCPFIYITVYGWYLPTEEDLNSYKRENCGLQSLSYLLPEPL